MEQAIAEYRFAYGRSAAVGADGAASSHARLGRLVRRIESLLRASVREGLGGGWCSPDRHGMAERTGRIARRSCTLARLTTAILYLPGRKNCPWCVIAAAGGPRHFRSAADVASVFIPDCSRRSRPLVPHRRYFAANIQYATPYRFRRRIQNRARYRMTFPFMRSSAEYSLRTS